MKNYQAVFFLSIVCSIAIGLQLFQTDSNMETYLDKSVQYVGTKFAQDLGFDGQGIKIAIIDTGVDYNHPDLFGFGPEGKVIGGYDFVDNDDSPIDTNGHGTQVAGVIAADGQLKGIAPKAKILAYRVSDDGESVSSELIIKAIEQAIIDKADIINISLGVNRTNQKIDEVVNKAIKEEIFVVTAAGNNGPELSTIGSPGINPNVITVGATYNNITASLVATLEINGKQYQVLPMVGIKSLDSPITAEIVFGKFARERDLENVTATDKILLAERGSDVEDEIVYFSDKEGNAAKAGAKALIVYNNKPGIYYGELTHEFAPPDYSPSIPTVSMSNQDGLKIKNLLENKTNGTLHVFYNPDFVAHFSSRGPVSPFYIKPDMVAPGAFINTTLSDAGYNFTSGTSFAAPHVAGAAALLLQKDHNLLPNQLKSILTTTADLVVDPYGNEFTTENAGSGRLNVTKAFLAKLVIEPTYLTFNLSNQSTAQTKYLHIHNLEQSRSDFKVSFNGTQNIDYDYKIENGKLAVTASLADEKFGKFEDRLTIEHERIKYNIPIIIYSSIGYLDVKDDNGSLSIQVFQPDWQYAKVSIINQDTGKTDTTSSTPAKNAVFKISEPGNYWIEAKVTSKRNSTELFEFVNVLSVTSGDKNFFDQINVPGKSILIVIITAVIIAVVGLKVRK